MAYAVLQAVAARLEREGRLSGPLPATFTAPGVDGPAHGRQRAGRAPAAAEPPRGRLSRSTGRANALRAAFAAAAAIPVRPLVAQLLGRRDSAPSAANANAPPTEMRATPSAASSAPAAPRTASTFTGRSTEATPDGCRRRCQPRREQHVGAGLLVGLQPGDRVGQIVAPVDVVLGAGGEHELHRPGVGDLDRGRTRSLARPRS